MRGHEDLVVTADGGEDRADVGVGERRIDVGRPRLRGRIQLARGRVLDRHEAGELLQAPHRLLVDGGADGGSRERR